MPSFIFNKYQMVENRWRSFKCELSVRRAAIKPIALFKCELSARRAAIKPIALFKCELSARRAAIKPIALFPATQLHSNTTYHPRILQSCGVCILSQTEHGIKKISTNIVFRLHTETGLGKNASI